MSDKQQGEQSTLAKGAQVAANVRGAIKTGKMIAGAAKGAALGPYGLAAGAIWQKRKVIGKIFAVILLLPILFIAMLPAMIFGTNENILTEGDPDVIVLNDDNVILDNIITVHGKLQNIIQEALTDIQEEIDSDFNSSDYDIKEVVNPYEGSSVVNPMMVISQYCASKDAKVEDIRLDDLESIVRKAKKHLFTFSREIREEIFIEIERQYNPDTEEWEDVEVEVTKQVATYTILYRGESYFADQIFHLSDEQKALAADYYSNLMLYLQDKMDLLVGNADFADLIGQFPFAGTPGNFMSPLPSLDWRTNVTDEFGSRGGAHRGIDIGAPYGTPIHAVLDGVVIVASPWVNSWGIYVVINHGDGLTTLSAHMSKMNVVVGQEVKQGDVIGYVGMTGVTSGPHLHFEVQKNGALKNPREFLPA